MVSSSNSAPRSAASPSMIIAPRTACSASWLQGAPRPWKASDAAVEELSCNTDVIPRRPFPVRVAQQRSGMVCDHQRRAVPVMHLEPQPAERLLHAQERLGRRSAQRQDHARAHQLDLPSKIRHTRLPFIGKGNPVPWRPALDHIGNEYLSASELDPREDLVEEFAGPT